MRIQSRHATGRPTLNGQARDEETARAVDIGPREQELRSPWMPVPRPLVRKRRLDVEARGVDDGLVLVGVEGADGVDEGAARTEPRRGGPEQRELEARERPRAPAEIWSPAEDAEPGARGIDECAVEPVELGRQVSRVRAHDRDVRRPKAPRVVLELARTIVVDLDRGDVAAEHRCLPAGRGACVENPLAVSRTDGQRRDL